MTAVIPDITRETSLLHDYGVVISCDEVGRGALAGPVAVGAVAIDAVSVSSAVPDGLRDSKLVSEPRRPALAQRAKEWVNLSAVGWASAPEIDEFGIVPSLGLAAMRALNQLSEQHVSISNAVILLDGNHDYISPMTTTALTVLPVVKADRDCASAAAASVIAKVARDTLMIRLHDDEPHYYWSRNKGYGSAAHRGAIREHGLSVHHRASWTIRDVASLS
ncbi:ribonuclease HII [Microbacterium endophyticum]|uniref:Ribonuclease n=1 Tax=Microbacterium endophyticum TaxID=1526412 RepID=A0A7W4V0I2_9MICO|nr:ribonuclease HII [Microbacterium endophyticum]MBB2974625.1 ribonuclease HII [Microbacterium endophyticum]NIK36922.1 ribonuclease HII [Microbacterium endophyticum]